MALKEVLVTKVMARSEHALRHESLVMLEGLGILTGAEPTTGGHRARVRVLTPRGSAAATAG